MAYRNFIVEIKRHRVYSVAVAYVVVSWLLVQIATQVFPFFDIPNWVVRLVVLLSILGFPVMVAATWVFESKSGTQRPAGRRLIALLIFISVVAAGVAFIHFLSASSEQDGQGPSAVEIDPHSIAVLPFENLSTDKSNAYFVSGMRDEILTSLAQLRELNVRSRTSAQRYQKDPDGVAAIGRALLVANILQGSVQKAGEDVLIYVQLVRTGNGEHLWAQSYRRKTGDVFGVQGEVAQQVADALRLKLAPELAQRLHVPPTTNPLAHDLFLRAHALGAHADEKSLEGKIALLQQAVAEDPNYAMAWGDLAGAYLTIADAYRAPLEVLGPMRRAALMAVQTDEGNGVGHIWLGAVSMLYDRNFPLARRELERAVALGPNSSDAHRWFGWYLVRVERDFDRGQAELEKARALDPFYTWPLMFECFIEIARGKYAKAMQFAERVMEIDPRFFYDVDPVASVYAAEERWEDGAKRYESLPAGLMHKPSFQLAICYAHLGKEEQTRRILTDLETLAQHRYIDQIHIAAIYGALEEKDKAFAALDQAADARSARVSTPRFYSWLAPLFDDPRFAAREEKVSHSALHASQ